ncbi:MAG: dihydrofolate reductase [Streptosporangiales bacterium]|nr:dihydrofolate reductase [Streptosporangiales bacterium]
MYLRTILELEEEAITPMRARIAERLAQSGPTVSQTVARMERDGLVHVADDRSLRLTAEGRDRAVAVMRKHRLAERLLVDVIGLGYEEAHAEACRWEHVMSDAVERRLYELLSKPTHSPYGNVIPGLEAFGAAAEPPTGPETSLAALGTGPAVVSRIGEHAQADTELLHLLHEAGLNPGAEIMITHDDDVITVELDGHTIELPHHAAAQVFATAKTPAPAA